MAVTEGLYVAATLFVFVVIVIAYGSFRQRQLTRPIYIENPILGLLDLSNGLSASDVDSDREILSELFSNVVQGSAQTPKCDVLLIYCQIEPDGRIRGSQRGLRDLIRESGAPVVVVASANTHEGYIAAAKKIGYGYANLVMTHDRKGDGFGPYFYQLFSTMKQGISMPVAWGRRAAPIPGKEQPAVPAVIFVCEAGQIAFR